MYAVFSISTAFSCPPWHVSAAVLVLGVVRSLDF